MTEPSAHSHTAESDQLPGQPSERCDLAVVGAGAAGLMAAIVAGRTAAAQGGRPLRIFALDGARSLGAKILVAGGGRCNVTHHAVDASDFAGSSRGAIAKVLRAFPVEATVAFFAERGVELVREPTGKLFPTTDSARTVLAALIGATRDAGVELRYPWRVAAIEVVPNNAPESTADAVSGPAPALESAITQQPGNDSAGGFLLLPSDDPDHQGSRRRRPLFARQVILTAGGASLPKTGSDGNGYELARSLGHTITPHVLPALVPLLLADGHPLRELGGIATAVRLTVVDGNGRTLRHSSAEGPLLCTHFGISGPAVLDVSRHLLLARESDPTAGLVASFLPNSTPEALDAELQALGPRTVSRFLSDRFADRLAAALAGLANVDPSTPGHRLARDARRRMVTTLTACPLPITGDRGFTYAEVTAGGVPLSEVDLATMASRRCPGLYLAGEILDVDGKIGGFNFQWAWASGTVAGRAAAARLAGG